MTVKSEADKMIFHYIKKWVDAHANLPIRARWIVKTDVAPYWSNQAECIDPPFMEGFMFVDSKINEKVVQLYKETHDCVLGLSLFIFQTEPEAFLRLRLRLRI
ncbi:hypothetical protein SAMN05421863_102523 [Nitrosomonas communis]|uniref:Uncharacterized protein n=1 Tax=Nitrosomonas communis TaxID=44574 RepID=A0A1I4Q8P1_9PROT|nr:hypothetical protein SAMN05421863_102523 [Nitrosomonas communis]